MALPADVQNWDASACQHFVDKGITLAAVGAIVRAVVELDHESWRKIACIAEHEIHTLGLNPVPIGLITPRRVLNFHQVGKTDLSEDVQIGWCGGAKHAKEVGLGSTQQMWNTGVWQVPAQRCAWCARSQSR